MNECIGCMFSGRACTKLQDGRCPCGACAVKMMCTDPCIEWGRWFVIEKALQERKDGWI